MLQYFFCLLLATLSFGYTHSVDDCDCNQSVEVHESTENIVIEDLELM